VYFDWSLILSLFLSWVSKTQPNSFFINWLLVHRAVEPCFPKIISSWTFVLNIIQKLNGVLQNTERNIGCVGVCSASTRKQCTDFPVCHCKVEAGVGFATHRSVRWIISIDDYYTSWTSVSLTSNLCNKLKTKLFWAKAVTPFQELINWRTSTHLCIQFPNDFSMEMERLHRRPDRVIMNLDTIYGLASISRLLKIIGLFCRISSLS